MFAVVELGSFQFKVKEGDIIDAPKLDNEVGKTFDADTVCLVAKDKDVKLGAPYLKGASVTFEVVRQFRDEKVINFVYRRRDMSSKRKKGHRQALTALKVIKIAG